jgi:hypothetical protein
MKHIKKYESFLSKSLGTAALAVTTFFRENVR